MELCVTSTAKGGILHIQ